MNWSLKRERNWSLKKEMNSQFMKMVHLQSQYKTIKHLRVFQMLLQRKKLKKHINFSQLLLLKKRLRFFIRCFMRVQTTSAINHWIIHFHNLAMAQLLKELKILVYSFSRLHHISITKKVKRIFNLSTISKVTIKLVKLTSNCVNCLTHSCIELVTTACCMMH